MFFFSVWTLLTTYISLCYAQSPSGNSTSNLNFGPVVFGGYNNYVYRDNTTSAQVVISQ